MTDTPATRYCGYLLAMYAAGLDDNGSRFGQVHDEARQEILKQAQDRSDLRRACQAIMDGGDAFALAFDVMERTK